MSIPKLLLDITHFFIYKIVWHYKKRIKWDIRFIEQYNSVRC